MALVTRPENVILVREVLGGLAEGLDLGGMVEDIKAAVSEAANNAVMHAYRGDVGPLEVEIAIARRDVGVVVRDHGVGIGPHAVDDNHPGRGIGLLVIETLATSCELRAHEGPGVEVAMRFDVPPQPELPALRAAHDHPPHTPDQDADIEIMVAPPWLSAPIFDRLVMGVAARANFSINRLSDVQLVMDALAARIEPALTGHHVRLAATAGDRCIELRVSPFRSGGAGTVVSDSAIGELGPVIGRLADEVATDRDSDGEVLAIVLRDRRLGAPSAVSAAPSEPGR
jgi:anti-sigma regulatory factor (Ser/Thr protein kinase)